MGPPRVLLRLRRAALVDDADAGEALTINSLRSPMASKTGISQMIEPTSIRA